MPKALVSGSGPDFTVNGRFQRAEKNRDQLELIQSIEPTQKAFVESRNE